MEGDKESQRDLKTQQNKFWLQTQVNDILEPMMLACCQANPENSVSVFNHFHFVFFRLISCSNTWKASMEKEPLVETELIFKT